MIGDEAVEAAAKAMYAHDGGVGEFALWVYQDYAKAMLEAAAPHMLAGLRELVEDMERQPRSEITTVPGMAVLIRAAVGDLLTPNPYRSRNDRPMSERFTIKRSVDYEAGREYVWWTVRDAVTGYLKDCRSEEEAKAHVAELESKVAPDA